MCWVQAHWDRLMVHLDQQAQLQAVIESVQPLDEQAMAAARQRQDQLTKPPGSLGRLERLATQLAGITGSPLPRLPCKAVIVMAADHGIAREGVSAYPPEVTAQMVQNFANGGAAINVLARQANARVIVVDVGVATELASSLPIVHRKVAFGTANFARGPAMTPDQALAAIAVGLKVVAREAKRGLDVVCLGEMGIGNTTAASALVAAMTRLPVASVTGGGSGIAWRDGNVRGSWRGWCTRCGGAFLLATAFDLFNSSSATGMNARAAVPCASAVTHVSATLGSGHAPGVRVCGIGARTVVTQ